MTRKINAGMDGTLYYSGLSYALNRFKQGYPQITSSINGTFATPGDFESNAYGPNYTYVDADCNILVPCPADVTHVIDSFYFAPEANVGEAPNMDGTSFTLMWDGVTDLAEVFNTGSGAAFDTSNVASGSAVVVLGTGAGNCKLRLHVLNNANPPRNLRAIQTEFMDQTVIDGVTYPGYNQGGVWDPYVLHELKKMRCLRFMDWMRTNNSDVKDFDEIATTNYPIWSQPMSMSYPDTTVRESTTVMAGTPLSVIASIGTAAGTEIWVNIPPKATDACVTAIAAYFRDNFTSNIVHYEYGNENWNSSFRQYHWMAIGAAAMPGGFTIDGGPGGIFMWAGYRSAQCMKLIRAAYGESSGAGRWNGVIAGHTVNPDSIRHMYAGINYMLANEGGGLTVNDIYDEHAITGYYTAICGYASQVTAISKASSAVVTADGHNFLVGERIKICLANPGSSMSQIDGAIGTITAKDATTFTFNINSTAYSTFVNDGHGFAIRAGLFDLMDASEAKNAGNPAAYPTIYTYFGEQMAELLDVGTCSSGLITTTSIGEAVTVDQMANTDWPAHKTYALAADKGNGLALTQYEANCHNICVNMLIDTANPWSVRAINFVTKTAYEKALVNVLDRMYREWDAIGGTYPAIFQLTGYPSRFGPWGTIKWFKSATQNPDVGADNLRYQTVLAATGAVKRMRARAA